MVTKEELMKMPLSVVRGWDIKSKEEEDIVQDVVNTRLQSLPPIKSVFRGDVPDIKDGEMEKQWQDIINQRESDARSASIVEVKSEESKVEEAILAATVELAEIKEEIQAIEPEVPKVVAKAKTKTKSKKK